MAPWYIQGAMGGGGGGGSAEEAQMSAMMGKMPKPKESESILELRKVHHDLMNNLVRAPAPLRTFRNLA